MSDMDHVVMKALSVKQPWANLIASGEKTIETRTWATDYRGELLIVSSRKPPIEPAGHAVAVATVIDCRRMTKADEAAARCRVYPGAYSWVLANVQRIKPFPVKGQLGIFEVKIPAASLLPGG
jgi:hypothetical protein